MRSRTSLIQTIGRAARNAEGRVILYADKVTESMRYAIDETNRRRNKQTLWNEANNITPATIKKDINDILESVYEKSDRVKEKVKSGDITLKEKDIATIIAELETKMRNAAANLEFEEAARLRDELRRIENKQLGIEKLGQAIS